MTTPKNASPEFIIFVAVVAMIIMMAGGVMIGLAYGHKHPVVCHTATQSRCLDVDGTASYRN